MQAINLILGALPRAVADGSDLDSNPPDSNLPGAARSSTGIVASGVTGFLAVWGTIRFLRTHTFTPFVIYRVALGAVDRTRTPFTVIRSAILRPISAGLSWSR